MNFEVREDALGWHGSNGHAGMTVERGGRMWKRRAIKRALSPSPVEEQWLVGELDGVRSYIKEIPHEPTLIAGMTTAQMVERCEAHEALIRDWGLEPGWTLPTIADLPRRYVLGKTVADRLRGLTGMVAVVMTRQDLWP